MVPSRIFRSKTSLIQLGSLKILKAERILVGSSLIYYSVDVRDRKWKSSSVQWLFEYRQNTRKTTEKFQSIENYVWLVCIRISIRVAFGCESLVINYVGMLIMVTSCHFSDILQIQRSLNSRIIPKEYKTLKKGR